MSGLICLFISADSGITTDLTVLYASVTAAVLVLAVAIIIVVVKRCCNKTPTSSEPKPVSKWEPFYENKLLLLRKECDREIEAERQAQEPTTANNPERIERESNPGPSVRQSGMVTIAPSRSSKQK
ncbi:hypothetical protein B5X24_HaOG215702 [Helicoverpa armigera]|uniref:Uncharacterized protein n=1 Tax=Helicoverpa armigera TaxID=29058 RepID=A0A2W1B4W9_HELAM|nr:hypothetical protein B5X24_HaOG215702 [Helicoverpa armigera]